MVRVIVNCDDLGQDVDTNLAISQGFADGVISSASLLPNMPGFEHAISLINKGEIPLNSIGIHINLTQGIPLTEPIRKENRFCSDDIFHGKIRQKPVLHLTSKEKLSVQIEIDAQIKKLRDQGIPLSHLDGHHHIHTEWGIFNAISDLLISTGLNKVRITRTRGICSRGMKGKLKLIYKKIFNFNLKRKGFKTTNEFGEFPDFWSSPPRQVSEIMVHYVEKKGKLVLDGQEEPSYQEKCNRFIALVELINYNGLSTK